jgi:hypothetical protein
VKVLTLCRRESSTLSAVIRAMWGGSPMGFANKSSADRCQEPHISCIGMVTPKELLGQTVGRSEVTNGMLNRFLLSRVRKHGSLPFGSNWGEVAATFSGRFREALERARAIGEVGWSDEAKALWEAEYERLAAARDGEVGSITARAADQCLRLALLYALADGSDRLLIPHLHAALGLYAHCDRTVADLYGPPAAGAADRPGEPAGSPDDEPLHVRLLAGIREEPGVRQSDLTRRFSHTPGADIQAGLYLLRQFGLAHNRVKPTLGRSAVCWHPGQGGTDDGPTGGGELTDVSDSDEPPVAEEEGGSRQPAGVLLPPPVPITAAFKESPTTPPPVRPVVAGRLKPDEMGQPLSDEEFAAALDGMKEGLED